MISNTEFLRNLTSGHTGKAWVTGFKGDPNKVSGIDWRGWAFTDEGAFPKDDMNSYFAVSTFHPDARNRKKEHIASPLCIVLDDVSTDDLAGLPPPSWELETSPHNFQAGYALRPQQSIEEVEKLTKGLAKIGHSVADKSGNNIARYVRLPKGVNSKASVVMEHGQPVRVDLQSYRPDLRYTCAQLSRLFEIGTGETHYPVINSINDHQLVEQVLTCTAFHQPLVQLSARSIGRGESPENTVSALTQLMDEAATSLNSNDRRSEWQIRRDAIPRYVASAVEKFSQNSPGGRDTPGKLIFSSTTPARLEFTLGSSVPPIPVRWCWPGWIAEGKFHLLAGPAGVSKTTVAMNLAATISRGSQFPDGAHANSGDVLIWSGEDGVSDTLVPRLLAARADMSRIHFLSNIREGRDRRTFDPGRDIDSLSSALKDARLPNPQLLIVDPVVAVVTRDSNKNAETRRDLQPLVDLASKFEIAILGITHFSKGTQGQNPTERVTGSLAFSALARIVIAAAKNREDGTRLIVRSKSNIGPDGGGFSYRIEHKDLEEFEEVNASHVIWEDRLEGDAAELLAVAEGGGEEISVLDQAKRFLRDVLKNGPVPVSDVKSWADAEGHSPTTITRAKRLIGVEAKKIGFDKWIWQLKQS